MDWKKASNLLRHAYSKLTVPLFLAPFDFNSTLIYLLPWIWLRVDEPLGGLDAPTCIDFQYQGKWVWDADFIELLDFPRRGGPAFRSIPSIDNAVRVFNFLKVADHLTCYEVAIDFRHGVVRGIDVFRNRGFFAKLGMKQEGGVVLFHETCFFGAKLLSDEPELYLCYSYPGTVLATNMKDIVVDLFVLHHELFDFSLVHPEESEIEVPDFVRSCFDSFALGYQQGREDDILFCWSDDLVVFWKELPASSKMEVGGIKDGGSY